MNDDQFRLEHHIEGDISDSSRSCIDDGSIYNASNSAYNTSAFSISNSVYSTIESAVSTSNAVYSFNDSLCNSSESAASSSSALYKNDNGNEVGNGNRNRNGNDNCNSHGNANGMIQEGCLYPHSQLQSQSDLQLSDRSLHHTSMSASIDPNVICRQGIEDIEEMIENSEDIGDDEGVGVVEGGSEREDYLAATDREQEHENDKTNKTSRKRSRNDSSSSSSSINVGTKKVIPPLYRASKNILHST